MTNEGNDDVLHPFKLRRLNDDSGETLRGERNAEAPARLADIVDVSQDADVEFVDSHGPENLGIAEAEHLRPADGQGIEAGDARAALCAGIWIVKPVIIEEIVGRELAPGRVRIDAAGSFIVPDGFRKSGRGK